MARFRAGRKSYRDTLASNEAALRFMSPDGNLTPEMQATFDRDRPKPKRERGPRKPSGKPLESNVLKAIIKALRAHPKVTRVVRNQSGVFTEGDRFIRVGTRGLADLTVYLGQRYGYIEVKVPGRNAEPHQQAWLANALQTGAAFAAVAHSVDDAVAIIEAKAIIDG